MSSESFMDLRNAPLSDSSKLFPEEALEKTVERSSRVLHDKAIQKAVSLVKPPKLMERLHFSQVACQSQPMKCPGSQSFWPA